jgi:hypothetical protein
VVPAAQTPLHAVAIVLTDAGISGAVGGAVIQGVNSVDTGVKTGVILFCSIGIVAPVVMWLRRARKLAAHGRGADSPLGDDVTEEVQMGDLFVLEIRILTASVILVNTAARPVVRHGDGTFLRGLRLAVMCLLPHRWCL